MISKQCKTPVPQKLVFPGCPGARSSMISTGQVDVTFLPDYPAPEALRKVRCWLFKSEDATKAEVEFGQVSEMKVKKQIGMSWGKPRLDPFLSEWTF